MQGPRQRRLAAARQAGEEHDQALLARRRQLEVDDLRDRVGQLALAGDAHDLTGGVRRHDPLAEPLVGVGIAARGHRHRHHGGTVQQPSRLQRGAQQPHPAQRPPLVRRRARARQRQQHHRLVGGVGLDGAQVLLGQRPGHRHRDRARVALAHLLGGEGEPPERAVLVVLQDLDRADHAGDLACGVGALDTHPRQRHPLGVDQLDRRPLGRQLVRERQRDAVRFVGEGGGAHRAVRDQLEVVELARSRAVLEGGGLTHVRHHAVVAPYRRSTPVLHERAHI